ncbi:hypothetical protein MFMK1_002214 [Metallumcola ferriviriculae]|uniref:Uncharacterized protein n=1 Tax=Metallumcola ferriviriculae TaxID=3039180 RepID=A0AAU0UQB7_9FIRM|nr:hypothetical protein MFMK1_002214 [Desulfitibacteraceae bacterium MK1]
MSKEDVLAILESDIFNPGSYKSGEYLEEHALSHAVDVLQNDRQGLIEALMDWIETQSEPRTMLAVRIAKNLGLVELKPQILELGHKIDSGKVFPRFYLRYIDETLNELEAKNCENNARS